MDGQALLSVFANAALPQKVVLLALVAALPLIVAAAAAQIRRSGTDRGPWRRLISDLRIAGPALGLLVGAMNGFHMAQTIQRVPFEPTAKQLAPGLLEVSTLVGLGALVGLVAVATDLMLGASTKVERQEAGRGPSHTTK
jgi:hypothetical protein